MHALIAAVSFVAAVLFLSVLSGIPAPTLLSDFHKTQFIPDSNTITLETPSGLNFLYLYYLYFVIATAVIYVFTRWQKGGGARKIL